MHHVNFEREVLLVDAMLGRRVEVELSQTEIGACEAGCAIGNDFNGRAQVLEFEFLLGDVDYGGFGCDLDLII